MDERAVFCYKLSILQAKFALTKIFERPTHGRQFFEEAIKENLDLVRSQHVSMIFGRRVAKCTSGKFQTRVITEGVLLSLHVSYKNSKIKQYFKEQLPGCESRALVSAMRKIERAMEEQITNTKLAAE